MSVAVLMSSLSVLQSVPQGLCPHVCPPVCVSAHVLLSVLPFVPVITSVPVLAHPTDYRCNRHRKCAGALSPDGGHISPGPGCPLCL
eukprot:scaffold22684_cov20-Tisochrysis_lutea.AAC.3